MKIGVVGLGKLGLPLALVFAKAGFEIEGVELSHKRLFKEIEKNKRVAEPKVNKYWREYRQKISTSTWYGVLKKCEVVFVVVQTPSLANHVFDTQYVEAAVKSIHGVNKDCLIVISSTVPPKTCDKLTKIHGRIAYNPEFIKQGSIIDDFEHPKFVMIGAYSKDEAGIVMNIWHKVNWMHVYWVPPLEAEIAKLALNVSFCKDITFANVIGEFCESMNADSKAVMDVVNLDKRSYQAGLGYGGVCFPRDTRCLRAMSKVKGEMFMDALHEVNDDVIWDYSRRILKEKGDIAFIGLTYKRGVPIIEESSAMNILTLVTHTLKDGIKKSKREIHVYDECGKEVYHQLKDFGGIIAYVGMENAIKNVATVFFGLPIKAPPKLLKGKRVIDPWGLNK